MIKVYNQATPEVRWCFSDLPKLVDAKFPGEVILPYLFSRIELAHNMMIYCGVVKLHCAEKGITWKVLDNSHMTRATFRQLFEVVFGKPIDKTALDKLETAEKIRDKVTHGHHVKDNEMREAVAKVVSYAVAVNSFVSGLASFKPFGDLRGFRGRKQSLDGKTTRWFLKGMGFSVR